jgi:hypothetical protein
MGSFSEVRLLVNSATVPNRSAFCCIALSMTWLARRS